MEYESKNFKNRYKVVQFIHNLKLPGTSKFSKLVSKAGIPKPSGSLIIETCHSFEMLVDPVSDKGIERQLYYMGTYEKGTLSVLDVLLSEQDIFLDIGANIGLMSLYASTHVGSTVVSVEANPSTVDILRFNMDLNGISNYSIIDKALGSSRGAGKIYSNWEKNRGSATLVDAEKYADSVEIDIIPLDDLSDDIDPSNVGVIKIDVEGFELEVLKGGTRFVNEHTHPSLIIEYSNIRDNYGDDDVYSYLKSLNVYQFYKLDMGKEHFGKLIPIQSEDDLPFHDNLICISKEKAASPSLKALIS